MDDAMHAVVGSAHTDPKHGWRILMDDHPPIRIYKYILHNPTFDHGTYEALLYEIVEF